MTEEEKKGFKTDIDYAAKISISHLNDPNEPFTLINKDY